MPARLRSLLAVSALVTTATLGAQQTRVVPAAAAGGGNTRSFPPFVVDAGLLQELVLGSALSVRSSLIRAIALRKDAPTASYQGRRIPRLVVRLGSSRRSPATMSTRFAANRAGRMVTVLSGAFNLPAQKSTPGSRPWNIVLAFGSPFAFLNTSGNLLIEIEMPGNAQRKFFYPVDGQVSGTAGAHRTFGRRGAFAGGDRFNVFSSLDQLRPGGEAILTAVNLKQAYPSLAIYGASRTRFGALRLPFDLGPIGAPGNFLHVSFDVNFPIQPRQIVPGLFTARAVAVLPNDPTLAGARLYGQTLHVDPPSNTLGVVLSNGVEMTLGGGPTTTVQALHALDTTRPSGGFVNPGRVGGPVLQLRGAFN